MSHIKAYMVINSSGDHHDNARSYSWHAYDLYFGKCDSSSVPVSGGMWRWHLYSAECQQGSLAHSNPYANEQLVPLFRLWLCMLKCFQDSVLPTKLTQNHQRRAFSHKCHHSTVWETFLVSIIVYKLNHNQLIKILKSYNYILDLYFGVSLWTNYLSVEENLNSLFLRGC